MFIFRVKVISDMILFIENLKREIFIVLGDYEILRQKIKMISRNI